MLAIMLFPSVFQHGGHLKFAGSTVFMAVLRTFYAESQDLAKRKFIWLTVICSV